ncbi:hypothetical protein BKA69DRAFT_1057702 [Paraphysoderma sedebokerense]|nr:hypothetical protein BKA69DRAFT_1057702 [Paraphysoderma sedebokerense]
MQEFAGLYIAETGGSIPLKSVHINGKILDSVSVTTIEQKYENASGNLLEAVYKFPIIANAAICAFEVEMNGKIQKGVVEEKKKAEEQYEDAIKNTTNQASLLTQAAGDVFQLNVGNIPPKTAVTIRITYTNELPTSSVGPNELVYTVPTTIAPRYGSSQSSQYSSSVVNPGDPAYINSSANEYAYTLSMLIDIRMSAKLLSVLSETHSIKYVQDGQNENVGTIEFANKDVKLDKDVILTITAEKLDHPVVVVEVDESNQSKCAMLTMVPRFKMKEIQNPEFIFVIDRSGSMGGTPIQNASAALALFIRSLPTDCTFNIVSFGSSYKAHFPLPAAPYSPSNLKEALDLCSNMQADFGGTEIYSCLSGIFESWNNKSDKVKKVRQIYLLTDGEIHDTDRVLELVRQEHEKNGTRVFSLGIGDNVSRALVDGLARLGRGDAQYISSNERMEKKVIAMLKKSLQPSMEDIRITWTSGVITSEQPQSTNAEPAKKLSLFDANDEDPLNIAKASKELDDLADAPKMQQSPFKIPPLYPMTRFTCFLVLPLSMPLLPKLSIKVKAPEGELDLEVSVPTEPIKGQMIHRLAAKRLITDLEEKTSYLDEWFKKKSPAITSNYEIRNRYQELVDKTAIRLAKTYSLTSSYTSFIAITASGSDELKEVDKVSMVVPNINPLPHLGQPAPPPPARLMAAVPQCAPPPAYSQMSMAQPLACAGLADCSAPSPPRAKRMVQKESMECEKKSMAMPVKSKKKGGFGGGGGSGGGLLSKMTSAVPSIFRSSAAPSKAAAAPPMPMAPCPPPSAAPAPSMSMMACPPPPSCAAKRQEKCDVDEECDDSLACFEEAEMRQDIAITTIDTHTLLTTLLQHQNFTGGFTYSTLSKFIPSLSTKLQTIVDKLIAFNSAVKSSKDKDLLNNLYATIVALVYMDKKLADIKDEWELVAEKAEKWVGKSVGDGKDGVDEDDIEKFVRELKKDVVSVVTA